MLVVMSPVLWWERNHGWPMLGIRWGIWDFAPEPPPAQRRGIR